ncbi:MAG TPA: hypothetical protein DDW50_04055 [Firmicutes bacterium]|jgi:hypothetical protein|nr:hypothetical protein [Bacillota bacterium]
MFPRQGFSFYRLIGSFIMKSGLKHPYGAGEKISGSIFGLYFISYPPIDLFLKKLKSSTFLKGTFAEKGKL